MKRLSILLLCAVIALAATTLYFREYRFGIAQQEQIHVLQAKLEELEKLFKQAKLENDRLNLALNSRPAQTSDQVQDPTLSNTYTAPQANTALPDRKTAMAGMSNWMVKGRLSEVEQYMTISPEQKERLTQELNQHYAKLAEEDAAFPDSKKIEEVEFNALSNVLGEEPARQFLQKREEGRLRWEQERVDQEVFSLSRKLSLNSDQEGNMRKAVMEVRDEMKVIQDEAYAKMAENMNNLHSPEGGAGKDNMADFDQVTQVMKEVRSRRRELMNSKLRGFLTDEQYNSLLADQASMPESIMSFGRP